MNPGIIEDRLEILSIIREHILIQFKKIASSSVTIGKLLKKLHPLYIKFCFWENKSPSSLLNPTLPRQSSQNKNRVAYGHSFLILIGSKI